jgi:hypothetical protein
MVITKICVSRQSKQTVTHLSVMIAIQMNQILMILAEQCPNIGANPNQINSLSTEQRKKVLIETHLTAEPYHQCTTPVVCKIGTGAELNVLSKHDYETIVPNPKRRRLEPPNIKITPYGGNEII